LKTSSEEEPRKSFNVSADRNSAFNKTSEIPPRDPLSTGSSEQTDLPVPGLSLLVVYNKGSKAGNGTFLVACLRLLAVGKLAAAARTTGLTLLSQPALEMALAFVGLTWLKN